MHRGKGNPITRGGSLTIAWLWGRAAMQNEDDSVIGLLSKKLYGNDGRESAQQQRCVANRNTAVRWTIEDLMAVLRMMIVDNPKSEC